MRPNIFGFDLEAYGTGLDVLSMILAFLNMQMGRLEVYIDISKCFWISFCQLLMSFLQLAQDYDALV